LPGGGGQGGKAVPWTMQMNESPLWSKLPVIPNWHWKLPKSPG